uniref:Uncharacterized protein n=1 Tax=Trichogramma kaykai TaxID=54128 RepID=A0ABD2WRV1_9HYME
MSVCEYKFRHGNFLEIKGTKEINEKKIISRKRLIGGARRDGTPGLSDASRAAVIATRGAMHAAHAASATRMLSGCVAATAHFAAQAGRRDGAEDLRRGQKAE